LQVARTVRVFLVVDKLQRSIRIYGRIGKKIWGRKMGFEKLYAVPTSDDIFAILFFALLLVAGEARAGSRLPSG